MALIKCPECGKEISEHAISCPNCGYPIKEQANQLLAQSNLNNGFGYFCNKKMIAVGDSVFFGTYPQGEQGEIKPLQWDVIDIAIDTAFLISKYIIDVKPFDFLSLNSQWDNSTIRQWLNNQFLNAAFTIDEQKMIAISNVPADKNPDSPISPGQSTSDKIFLLSSKEFYDYEAKINNNLILSQYCSCVYSRTWGLNVEPCVCDPKSWLLRSPGNTNGSVQYVGYGGNLYTQNNTNKCSIFGLRPALKVRISM